MDLKKNLVNRLKQIGAYDVKVADPYVGFEMSVEGKHPLALFPACKSVVVFLIAMSPEINNLYLGPFAPFENEDREQGPVPGYVQSKQYAMNRLSRLFRESIRFKGMKFLYDQGYQVSFAKAQTKLCAYESGLGVYGKNGLIINPQLGNRINIDVIFTDAVLQPDKKLIDFSPCLSCDNVCLKSCPANVYDLEKEYPESWSFQKCEEYRKIADSEGSFCHNCFVSCKKGTIKDEDLLSLQKVKNILDRR